jgi:hypothetical protein
MLARKDHHFCTKNSRFRARRTLIAKTSQHIFGDRQKGAIFFRSRFFAKEGKKGKTGASIPFLEAFHHTYHSEIVTQFFFLIENILCQAVFHKPFAETTLHHAEHEDEKDKLRITRVRAAIIEEGIQFQIS